MKATLERLGARRPVRVAGAPADAAELTRRVVERRAIEAVTWGLPIVNYDRMVQAAFEAGADFNQVVYWSGRTDWKNQTLTPDPDVIALMPFVNTKDVGPVVLDIPPADDGAINGSLMDCWQTAFEDVGLAGADMGRGAKYLILPPGYREPVPDGYVTLTPACFQSYGLLRSLDTERDAHGAAVAYGKQVRLYQLSQAANPPPTIFVDAIHRVFDATIPYDMSFFRSLHRMVQTELWSPRDTVMVDMLKTIGIEKGRPFTPDGKTRDLLLGALREAHALLNARFETNVPPYYEGRHWFIVGPQDAIDVDHRALEYSCAFGSSKQPGAGPFRVFSLHDRVGAALDGGNTYRLTVPPNVPASRYWSVAVYDRATHAFIRHVTHPGCSSQTPGLQMNRDGSVEIHVGPNAPAGWESNWIPTLAGGTFEVCMRFHGAEKPLFDRTWTLPDLERA